MPAELGEDVHVLAFGRSSGRPLITHSDGAFKGDDPRNDECPLCKDPHGCPLNASSGMMCRKQRVSGEKMALQNPNLVKLGYPELIRTFVCPAHGGP